MVAHRTSRIKMIALLMSFAVSVGSVWAADTAPATAPTTAAVAQTVPSLIPNGDFEKLNKEGAPEGWKATETITFPVENNNHFMRLQVKDAGKMVMAYRAITLKPEYKAFELSYKVRYSGIKRGKELWFDGRIMMNFRDDQKKEVKPSPKPPVFKGSSEGWVEKTQKFNIPEGAKTFEIMFTLFNAEAGTLEFDDIKLVPTEPVEKTEAPAPKATEVAAVPVITAAVVTPMAFDAAKMPKMLHVDGNKLKTPEGKEIWLQGLSVDSLQWSEKGDKILQSIPVAIEQWKANAIRLPVKDDFWFGKGKYQKDGGAGYRKIIDDAVEAAGSRGAYIAIDLHRFGAPMPDHVEFWKDVAVRYKNHPAVLFEIFNEPHGISWKIWRDGGDLKDPKNEHKDENVTENTEKNSGRHSPGMQAIVDAIRATGAKNVIAAAGLDWGYDLTGVVGEYALKDATEANGIMYVSHIYPWKKGWEKKMLVAADKYPIFITEVGCIRAWEDFKFIPENQRSEKLGPDCTWSQDMLGLIQKRKLNWTGFSFHPKCGPMVIADWNYTPTPYWGVFVKDALEGKQFELKKMR